MSRSEQLRAITSEAIIEKNRLLKESEEEALQRAIQLARLWVVENKERLSKDIDRAAGEGRFEIELVGPPFIHWLREQEGMRSISIAGSKIFAVMQKDLEAALQVPIERRSTADCRSSILWAKWR